LKRFFIVEKVINFWRALEILILFLAEKKVLVVVVRLLILADFGLTEVTAKLLGPLYIEFLVSF
jgi:hypothetical protein